MLKLKDNVKEEDLKWYDIHYSPYHKDYRCEDFKISTKKRHILAFNNSGYSRFDRIYRMTVDGLIEEVE